MKIGEYVRTEDGQLFRWDKWFTTDKSKDNFDSAYIFINTNSIIKSSPNIIDLIEVGDYVNGERVISMVVSEPKRIETIEYSILYEKDIKSILTKEQFESMKYRIGE